MLAKLTSKNQLTLPKAITGAIEATDYFDVTTENGRIVLTPVRINRADGVRAKTRGTRAVGGRCERCGCLGSVEQVTTVRPVVGTNVLVSALLFHSGALSWLRGAWRSERLRPLASRETTTELIRVLAYPEFALDAHEQRELLDDYLPFCETVTVPRPPPPTPACRDPSDRPFLELALAGSADALVTGNANIRMLTEVFAVPILSPAAFRRRFSYQEADVE